MYKPCLCSPVVPRISFIAALLRSPGSSFTCGCISCSLSLSLVSLLRTALWRCNSHSVQFTRLKLYSAEVFSLVSELCIQHQNQFQNVSITPRRVPLSLRRPQMRFLCPRSPILDVSRMWDHVIRGLCVCLVTISSRFSLCLVSFHLDSISCAFVLLSFLTLTLLGESAGQLSGRMTYVLDLAVPFCLGSGSAALGACGILFPAAVRRHSPGLSVLCACGDPQSSPWHGHVFPSGCIGSLWGGRARPRTHSAPERPSHSELRASLTPRPESLDAGVHKRGF